MTTKYPIKLSVSLRPIWHQDPPEVSVGINKNLTTISLTEASTINFDLCLSGSNDLVIELLNKTDADTVPDKNLDKAVVIEDVSFFGISDPKFVWLGVYEPVYPEPWATEQHDQGVVLKPQLTNQTYLGFNGKWTLTFEMPIFTWIHRVQGLGWIYG